jgi:putative endonuclease
MRSERRFWVYILANKPYGTLYIGMTNDLELRVFQHKERLFDGFSKRYGIKHLVFFEDHATAASAIHREKRIKKWSRAQKITLLRTNNPDWRDLAADWYPKMMTAEEIENWIARTTPGDDGGGE